MSHEVQPSPAASNSPAATLPSSAPAGHVTEAPEIVTPHKSGFSGHFSQPPQITGPDRDRRGGTDPHAHHARKPAFLPAARGALAARRGPAHPPAPPMPAHRERQGASHHLPSQPGSDPPARPVTPTGL
jgi:hypothetical protein